MTDIWMDSAPLTAILVEAPRFGHERLETGGYLFGYRYPDLTIRVLHATGPGPKAERRWDFLQLDDEHYRAERDRIQSQDEYCGVVGGWHTHPPGYPHASPADDEVGWWMVEHWGLPCWYEFIVTVADDGQVERIRVYRYTPGQVREELSPIEMKGAEEIGK